MFKLILAVVVVLAIVVFSGQEQGEHFKTSSPVYHIGGLSFMEEEMVNIETKDGTLVVYSDSMEFEVDIFDIIDIRTAKIGRISIDQSRGNVAIAGLLFGPIGAITASSNKETTKHRNVIEFKYRTDDGDRFFVIGENPVSNSHISKPLIEAIKLQKENITWRKENMER